MYLFIFSFSKQDNIFSFLISFFSFLFFFASCTRLNKLSEKNIEYLEQTAGVLFFINFTFKNCRRYLKQTVTLQQRILKQTQSIMAIGVICFEHAFVTNLLIKILEPLSTLSFVFTKEKTFFARIGWRLFKENSNTLHRVCLDKCHQKLKFRKKKKRKKYVLSKLER